MNIAIAVGRVIQDNTLYTSIGGKNFTNIKVSIDRGKDKDGNWLSTVLTYQLWEKNAEYACKYVHKGDIVAIEGRIDVRKDWDEHINKNRYTYVLTGTRIERVVNNNKTEYSHEEFQKVNDKVQNNSNEVKTKQVSDEEMAKQMKVFTDEITFNDDELPW